MPPVHQQFQLAVCRGIVTGVHSQAAVPEVLADNHKEPDLYGTYFPQLYHLYQNSEGVEQCENCSAWRRDYRKLYAGCEATLSESC
jgi:hypothetical protein